MRSDKFIKHKNITGLDTDHCGNLIWNLPICYYHLLPVSQPFFIDDDGATQCVWKQPVDVVIATVATHRRPYINSSCVLHCFVVRTSASRHLMSVNHSSQSFLSVILLSHSSLLMILSHSSAHDSIHYVGQPGCQLRRGFWEHFHQLSRLVHGLPLS